MPIVVVDYDSQWPVLFETLAAPLRNALATDDPGGSLALSVEHVGSTSAPGLAAKPIIDMGIVTASREAVPAIIERLATLGYRHRGDLGVPGREAFQRPEGTAPHHLYLYAADCEALRNHLAVRDALRRDAALAEEYGRLKKRLAAEYPDDIDRYVAGKTPLLIEILRKAGFAEESLQAIEAINRLP